jgi:signal transduction histidine kinase
VYRTLSERYAPSGLAAERPPIHGPHASRARAALRAYALASASVILLLVIVWALTSRGYFWPIWPVLVLALPLAIQAWIVFAKERRTLWREHGLTLTFVIRAGVCASLLAFLVGIWAASGGGYFWPVWPLLAMLVTLGTHLALVLRRRPDRAALSERISVLESSRAGAVDVQDSDLRRIERDLHDGAQARLVALGMSIGMAEQKLANDVDGARELLAEARAGAGEALRELRDLARGIHPPVLADRGLEAAVRALAAGLPMNATVSVDLPSRPPGPVETAAYFVVAEALANAGKHAGATRVDVRAIADERGHLVVEIQDNGHGGADPTGRGLAGLRHRVQALDGTLSVVSPAGGPTTIRAELPCEW